MVDKYAKHYDLPAELFFDSIEVMLDKVKPEAVAAFNKISEHIDVVEACAPRGVHVMVEKPLATNFSDAQKMVSLARKHDIQLLTSYGDHGMPVLPRPTDLFIKRIASALFGELL